MREQNLARTNNEECLVDAKYSLVSTGTESLVFRGQVPLTLHEEMKCPNMAGSFAFPIKYGYSLVGEVLEGPPELIGQHVHTLYPHQDKCLVSPEEVFIIPREVALPRATLASNLETAVNAIWDSKVTIGERVLVVGFGFVGSLVARILTMMPQLQVDVIDTNPTQQALAKAIGFSVVEEKSVARNFYDAAFHTSGSGNGLQTAVNSVAFEGRVIELSWYGEKEVSLALGGTFHSMRKSIMSSQVSNIASSQRCRWDNLRRKKLVFELLRNDIFDLHLTHCFQFSNLPNFFNQQLNSVNSRLGCLVKFKTSR